MDQILWLTFEWFTCMVCTTFGSVQHFEVFGRSPGNEFRRIPVTGIQVIGASLFLPASLMDTLSVLHSYLGHTVTVHRGL